jgi:hypothetical protein
LPSIASKIRFYEVARCSDEESTPARRDELATSALEITSPHFGAALHFMHASTTLHLTASQHSPTLGGKAPPRTNIEASFIFCCFMAQQLRVLQLLGELMVCCYRVMILSLSRPLMAILIMTRFSDIRDAEEYRVCTLRPRYMVGMPTSASQTHYWYDELLISHD